MAINKGGQQLGGDDSQLFETLDSKVKITLIEKQCVLFFRQTNHL